MSKPIVYEDVMNELDFLNEMELGYLRMGDERLKKMLLNRAKMFQACHRAFIEYNDKDNSIRRLGREEWRKKIYRVLNLTFKMDNEKCKGIVDLYWLRVTLPKGGIK
jgi:hypothetical protein